jgi:ribosomal protein S18 acetylase RimI-like enzyme
MKHPLDNPVWEALCSKQAHFNSGGPSLKYFPRDISPFIALNKWNEADLTELELQAPADRSFSVMKVKEIVLPESFEIGFTIPLYQMVCKKLIPFDIPGTTVLPLTKKDIPQMLALTALTKPGPFYERTIEFGNYMGIFEGQELIAMAGERLQLPGYTEISAICTKPTQLGKGYASYLLSRAAQKVIREGSIPFLHVRNDNHRAIQVYEKLGFEKRAEVFFAIFKSCK